MRIKLKLQNDKSADSSYLFLLVLKFLYMI